MGKEWRVIPLFPELRPYVQAVLGELLVDFDPKLQRLSEQPVITRYRDANSNLRTQLERIIQKAGLKPWPKLFQNLRSTRETELAEEYPMHVVCAWIGNSQAVAAQTAQIAVHPPVPGDVTSGIDAKPKREKPRKFAIQRDSEAFEAPPVGLEPTTKRLTVACSTN